jgi:inner membrane protein
MDSLTHCALGACIAGAVLGPRPRPWRALLWGAVVATLPDLDVLIDHGDAVANMVCHRGHSHSLVWMTLLAPALAWGIAALHRERASFGRWWLAVWLALVTHALLDAMTAYGTRLLLPFTSRPFAVGSLFVIDPLVTLPLLLGAVLAARSPARGRRWCSAGLLCAGAYAGWSLVAQQLATIAARRDLAAQGIDAAALLVAPAPLQTLLWRVLASDGGRAYEGFWSLADGDRPIAFTAIDRGAPLQELVAGMPAWRRLAAFAGDFVRLEQQGTELRATDLRLGQEPHYVFSFVLATATPDGSWRPVAAPQRSGARIDVGRGLAWLWPRMWGAELPPPR